MYRSASLAALLCALTIGCGGTHNQTTIVLATTTSTRDSGLLDELVPWFEEQADVEVKVIAVGSGQALELGRRGDADVLLTHAPHAEEEFVEQGHASSRRAVMHNDFIFVGPAHDPARLVLADSTVEALEAIRKSAQPFVSRGDDSGTHMKERRLWQAAGVEPAGDWYIRGGMGMAQALRLADQKRAYTLSDRGTFLAQRDGLDLVPVYEGDPLLRNPYSVIVPSADKHVPARHQAAEEFADFLLSPDVQRAIAEFGRERYGQPLFYPREEAE